MFDNLNTLATYKYIRINPRSCVGGPLQECRSIQPGASGLPYYSTPPLCIPPVLGALPVWRLSIKINKKAVP
jgi:hypothetical protein